MWVDGCEHNVGRWMWTQCRSTDVGSLWVDGCGLIVGRCLWTHRRSMDVGSLWVSLRGLMCVLSVPLMVLACPLCGSIHKEDTLFTPKIQTKHIHLTPKRFHSYLSTKNTHFTPKRCMCVMWLIAWLSWYYPLYHFDYLKIKTKYA